MLFVHRLHNGQVLSDDKTLWFYNVPNEAKIMLMLKSKIGGGTKGKEINITLQEIKVMEEKDNLKVLVESAIEAVPTTGPPEAADSSNDNASVNGYEFPIKDPTNLSQVVTDIPFYSEWRSNALWKIPSSSPQQEQQLSQQEDTEHTNEQQQQQQPPQFFVLRNSVNLVIDKETGNVDNVRLLREDSGLLTFVDDVRPVARGNDLYLYFTSVQAASAVNAVPGSVYALTARASGCCTVCGKDEDDEHMLVCDGCDGLYHMQCLDPPLTTLPEGDWFCPTCAARFACKKRAGNTSNNDSEDDDDTSNNRDNAKMRMPSSRTTRKWGGGFSCVGRTKVCTIVGKTHFGKIPGIPVGKQWKYRYQVSEAGVHRPLVAGIHGNNAEGCYSIVTSGGYEDDEDHGDEIIYTGSGGRDLSGNKRTATNSKDQTLTGMNKNLAFNCVAHKGCRQCTKERGCDKCRARWREGKPIRVCRNEKLHNEFSPAEGIRYDGIYKLVDYWPQKGKAGFIVYRYLLRRDDDEPAPWTPEGKKLIAELGLDKMDRRKRGEAEHDKEQEEGQEQKGKEEGESESEPPPAKKNKMWKEDGVTFLDGLSSAERKKKWNDRDKTFIDSVKNLIKECVDEEEFLRRMLELLRCPVCYEDEIMPTYIFECSHHVCRNCIDSVIKVNNASCPMCRRKLEDTDTKSTSEAFRVVAEHFLPYATKH